MSTNNGTFESDLVLTEALGMRPFNNIEPDTINSANDNDSSGDEQQTWLLQDTRHQRRGRQINTFDNTNSDSNGEAPSIPRRRARSAIESDRELFAQHFGNPDRRPASVSSRGWNNRSGIAQGERISNQTYGSSRSAIQNTSLEDPPSLSTGSPPGMCAERRELQARQEREATRAQRIMAEAQTMTLQARERRLLQQLDANLDEREDALLEHRNSGQEQSLLNELHSREQMFRASNSAAFAEWDAFVNIARNCTSSKSRQYQITQWYTGDVPSRVRRQLRRVEAYYTREAILQDRVRRAEEENARERLTQNERQRNDDVWAATQRMVFGYDAEDSTNGFNDYVSKGDGLEITRHLAANFEARKVRLQHASAADSALLSERMLRFVRSAVGVLDKLRDTSEQPQSEFQQRVARIQVALAAYRRNPVATLQQSASTAAPISQAVDITAASAANASGSAAGQDGDVPAQR